MRIKIERQWQAEADAGTFWLWGPLDDDIALAFTFWLRGRQGEPSTLQLSTPGGPGHVMLQMVNAIESVGRPLTIIASGRCLSAGIPILAAGKPRRATASTQFMLHGGEGSMAEVAARNDWQARYLASRTAQKYGPWIQELSTTEGRWITIDNALNWGLIDTIIPQYELYATGDDT